MDIQKHSAWLGLVNAIYHDDLDGAKEALVAFKKLQMPLEWAPPLTGDVAKKVVNELHLCGDGRVHEVGNAFWPALHVAAYQCNLRMLNKLLFCGANVNHVNHDAAGGSDTALSIAITFDARYKVRAGGDGVSQVERLRVVKLLCLHGACRDNPHDTNETAEELCVANDESPDPDEYNDANLQILQWLRGPLPLLCLHS